MFQKLRAVILAAPDLAAATRFYADVLGFEPYFNEAFYVGFDVNGSELGLVPDGAQPAPNAGVLHYWAVASASDALARLEQLGATRREEIQDVGGGMRTVTVSDPWGNIVGVIEGAP